VNRLRFNMVSRSLRAIRSGLNAGGDDAHGRPNGGNSRASNAESPAALAAGLSVIGSIRAYATGAVSSSGRMFIRRLWESK